MKKFRGAKKLLAVAFALLALSGAGAAATYHADDSTQAGGPYGRGWRG